RSAVVQLVHGVFTGLNSSRDSSSVTSLMRPAGFPEHESVHSAPADKSRWGLPCFSGENRAQRRRGSHVVLRLRRRLLRRARTRVAAFGPSHLGQTLRHSVSRSPGHALLQARSPVSPIRPVRTVRDSTFSSSG